MRPGVDARRQERTVRCVIDPDSKFVENGPRWRGPLSTTRYDVMGY